MAKELTTNNQSIALPGRPECHLYDLHGTRAVGILFPVFGVEECYHVSVEDDVRICIACQNTLEHNMDLSIANHTKTNIQAELCLE